MSAVGQITMEVRAHQCAVCPTPCDRQHAATFHADPCSECPLPRGWKKWDCGKLPAGSPSGSSASNHTAFIAPLKPSALRFVRTYVRQGFPLILGTGRRVRRNACATCELRIEHGRGLYGCGQCKVCGSSTDRFRLLRPAMKCPLGKWPISPQQSSPKTARPSP